MARRFGADALDRSLRRLARASERIRSLARQTESELARATGRTSAELGERVRAFYGRLASHVREIDDDLDRLEAIDRFLSERPAIDPARPTVVVAGFPNVGKSSLVARLSSARPEVAPYPFTTRSLQVGHADLGFDRLQVVDTPGLLGRADRTNPVEDEALVAVEHAATIVVFVIDPTESCGYPLAEQERLLETFRRLRPNVPIVEVETKSDVRRRPSGRLSVSAVTGEGIPELVARIEREIAAQPRPPPPPVDHDGATD